MYLLQIHIITYKTIGIIITYLTEKRKNISKTETTTYAHIMCTFCSVDIMMSYRLGVWLAALFLRDRAFLCDSKYYFDIKYINILYSETGATKTRQRPRDDGRRRCRERVFLANCERRTAEAKRQVNNVMTHVNTGLWDERNIPRTVVCNKNNDNGSP